MLLWVSLQTFLIKWEGNWGSEISTPSIAGLGLSDYYWHWDVTGNCIRWCCGFSDWLVMGTAELGIAVVVLGPFISLHLYTEGIHTWKIPCWLLMFCIACIMTWYNLLSIYLLIFPTLHLFFHSCIHLFIHQFICSLIHQFIYSFIHSLTHSCAAKDPCLWTKLSIFISDWLATMWTANVIGLKILTITGSIMSFFDTYTP